MRNLDVASPGGALVVVRQHHGNSFVVVVDEIFGLNQIMFSVP